MAIPLVRSNIVIFFVSMTLVLTLALGVYVSNRLLTHWLLVGGLEQDYIHQKADIQNILAAQTVETQKHPLQELQGLRPSLTNETLAQPSVSSRTIAQIRKVLEHKYVDSTILDTSLVYPSGEAADRPGLPNFAQIDWLAQNKLTSVRTLNHAWAAFNSDRPLTIVPDMTWFGAFGSNAIVVFNPDKSREASPSLVLLVTQSGILKSLSGLIWSISAAIGVLCLISFAFAAILLWMRFYDQVRTNSNFQYLAHHDTLTGLPNRAVFNAKLAEALRLAQAKASNVGVMLIDVDKFKEINDTHGHGIGDVFLQVVGERLQTVFHKHLVARLSGDEFAVLMTSVSDPARMTRLAADMIAATNAPCIIDGNEIKLSLSIGIARATDGSWRVSRLLHCADLALYNAKHSGRSTFSWYTPGLDAEAQKRKEVENGLVKALKLDQFKLLYQPQYALRDGTLRGYEALVRWEHPSKGEIRPDLFIPIAEDCGLIDEIGTWVLNNACREAMLWEDLSRRVAVNVSAAQFVAGETQKRVAQALHSSGLDPSRLEIEITESLLISNTEAVIETLRQIHDMGVSIAMDDFGTGYSSLSYLSLFPFDKIKIDQTFVQNLGKDPSTDAIVTSIVGLGRSLNVTITAEGVETEEQAVLLSAAGCDLVQGYMFGKPDSVKRHEADYPIFPHNEDGGFWFPQKRKQAPDAPKITLSPSLAQYAKISDSPSSDEPETVTG
ncbi:bifunctional diguanylate cyclase/phosphodiesterase [Roseibium sp. MMSF_3412]|uniref:putative bifunctional diguanylate cyclase/phosphodiesterase n=1 Tax=Roseibium sp. MMSF_3412 TaxID=3046712 RepID=UPI00273D44CA|nr:EAL domain-containing protein [Roseibium sp. MMSF_3412]